MQVTAAPNARTAAAEYIFSSIHINSAVVLAINIVKAITQSQKENICLFFNWECSFGVTFFMREARINGPSNKGITFMQIVKNASKKDNSPVVPCASNSESAKGVKKATDKLLAML